MKKKWIICIIVVLCLICVFITKAYCNSSNDITTSTFIGTYQINGNVFETDSSPAVYDYLAISYDQDFDTGEFTIYNSETGVIFSGNCQMDGDYLTLISDERTYLLLCIQNKYYFISESMHPEIIEKVADNPVVQ